MATEKIGGSFGIDTRELKSFIKALRRASPTGAKGLRVAMKASGEIVAVKAREIAAEHSTTIGPTIKAGVYGATVSVRAGKGVPLAALYELGNKGTAAGKDSDTFRHPVYGHATIPWAVEARYPFLRPALDATAPEVEAAVLKVADEVADVLTGHFGF
jgi:hypothetical protein